MFQMVNAGVSGASSGGADCDGKVLVVADAGDGWVTIKNWLKMNWIESAIGMK